MAVSRTKVCLLYRDDYDHPSMVTKRFKKLLGAGQHIKEVDNWENYNKLWSGSITGYSPEPPKAVIDKRISLNNRSIER